MLKIRRIVSQEQTCTYYLKNPTLTEKEKTGYWLGKYVPLMGFKPNKCISQHDLYNLLNGYDAYGLPVYRRYTPKRRAGWDFVISSSKSISVGALCMPKTIRQEIQDSFHRSCHSLFQIFEHLGHTKAVPTSLPTGNFICGHFTHQASRHNDPHLHSHLLLPNATCVVRPEKNEWFWGSAEPAYLYRCQNALDQLFQYELSRNLKQYGYRINWSGKYPELNIPNDLCVEYSKAHNAIKEASRRFRKPLNFSDDGWANRINDKIRPRKRFKQPRFDCILPRGVRMELASTLKVTDPPPPSRKPNKIDAPAAPAPPPIILDEQFHYEMSRALKKRMSVCPIESHRVWMEEGLELLKEYDESIANLPEIIEGAKNIKIKTSTVAQRRAFALEQSRKAVARKLMAQTKGRPTTHPKVSTDRKTDKQAAQKKATNKQPIRNIEPISKPNQATPTGHTRKATKPRL